MSLGFKIDDMVNVLAEQVLTNSEKLRALPSLLRPDRELMTMLFKFSNFRA